MLSTKNWTIYFTAWQCCYLLAHTLCMLLSRKSEPHWGIPAHSFTIPPPNKKQYSFTEKESGTQQSHTAITVRSVKGCTVLNGTPYVLITKPIRCTNFSHLFWNKTLHVSDSSSVTLKYSRKCDMFCRYSVYSNFLYNRILSTTWFTILTTMYTYIYTSNFTHLWNFSMTYKTAVCTVKNSWWWTEELSGTCRVLFQNKFEKLVHLVGFIIQIYHDARSPECQRYTICLRSLI